LIQLVLLFQYLAPSMRSLSLNSVFSVTSRRGTANDGVINRRDETKSQAPSCATWYENCATWYEEMKQKAKLPAVPRDTNSSEPFMSINEASLLTTRAGPIYVEPTAQSVKNKT